MSEKDLEDSSLKSPRFPLTITSALISPFWLCNIVVAASPSFVMRRKRNNPWFVARAALVSTVCTGRKRLSRLNDWVGQTELGVWGNPLNGCKTMRGMLGQEDQAFEARLCYT